MPAFNVRRRPISDRLGGLLDIDWICFDGLDVRLSQLGVGPAVRQEQDASEHY